MTRPLVYYAITIFMGCTTVLVLINNPILGAVVAASFLCTMYFTIDKKFFYVVVCFFIIGAVNYYAYFNVNLPGNEKLTVRISDKSSYYCYANYNNKKILLEGNTYKLIEGRNVWISGNFKRIPLYERGVVGTYTVIDYKICDEDIISKINSFKEVLYEKFLTILGEEKTAMVMAVCFGDAGYIEKTQKEDFKKLGISHVISVSGLHMSIVYKALENIVGYKIALLCSFFYMIFTGGKASTIRAFVMIFILKISSKIYKKYDSLSSLSLAAIILLLIRPFSILDIGFMLSFLCVLGIILYNKKVNKVLYKLPAILNESFSLSISSQIFSMPYATLALKTFSLGFVISNLLLLPFYTIVVVLGNVGLVLSWTVGLFKLINYGLFTVLTIIESIQKLLGAILPELINFSYIESLVVFGLYLCYLGIKSGYKQFKYVPLCFVFILLFQNYKVFPEISYLTVNSNDIVLLQYKNSAIVVTTGIVSPKDLKVPVKIDKITQEFKGDSIINLSDKYAIRLISGGNKLEAQICFLEKNSKDGFIKLKKDDIYTAPGTIIVKYIIIWKRILKFP